MRLAHHPRATPPVGRDWWTLPRRRQEGGFVMAMFGLLLVPLLLLVGLAIDVGFWYNQASDIQKAADAAALAGVVWLPDEAKAREVALDVAKRNGYTNGVDGIVVTVSKSNKAPRRLQVAIKDPRVGSFFYSNLGGDEIDLTRGSYAEYITPVPMGSPRNYFGTGKLLADDPELLYQSVNPYCTDKVQGDRHQSRNFGGTCSSALNTDYKATGYELYIDAVASRTSPIEIRLYDPRYSTADISSQVESGQNCVDVHTYPTQTTSGWTQVPDRTRIYGPKQYQTRANTTTNTWSAVQTLADSSASTVPPGNNRLRWRSPSSTTQNCTPVYTTVTEAEIDLALGNSATEQYTYKLYAADSTPLDDSDNPVKCTKTFTGSTAFDGYLYLNSRRWNTLCTIGVSDPSGKYILRVTNNGAQGNTASGANQYGVVAKYANASGDGLCDGRVDVLCPRVYGKEAISVYANTAAATASFYLAEIGPEHAGKKLRLELWDPGEGGNNIQIMKPTGTNTWAAVPFTWKEGNGASTTTNTLSVTNSVFNGKLVEITVDLTNYAPPSNNNWWQIKYQFTSGANVTDRTTWSARILGDPVHLIEEN